MSGYQQLHALAEDELVGHAFAVGITRVHQGLEKVVAGNFVASLPDVFEQNHISPGAHLFMLAQLARDGEPWVSNKAAESGER